MDNIDYKALIKLVEDNTRSSARAEYVNGKAVANVANLGAKVGDVARVDRNGEFSDLTVEILEPTRRLLTDISVTQILKMLDSEDYTTPVDMYSLISLDMLAYVLDTWFRKHVVGYRNNFKVSKTYPVLDEWINTVTTDPLLCKIKVIGIGLNTNTQDSVVPIEWVDRIFPNGKAMHAAMSELPARLGKPPVTYAVIYTMVIDKKMTISKDITTWKQLFYVDVEPHNVVSELSESKRPGYEYVKYGDTAIGFKLTDLLEPKKPGGTKDVGVLVSRLQKAIRRGKYGSGVLIETIEALNKSPNYNLPEHSFMRVSASKQLAWRLYITILEDVRPYNNSELMSLQTLILLALICNVVTEYRFTQPVLRRILKLALAAQYNETHVEWEKLTEAKQPRFSTDEFKNSIVLATKNLTMMSGDRSMLLKYYNYSNVKPFEIPKYSSLDSKPSVDKQITLASYDQHNRTYIILYYQACIATGLTTKQVAKHIWDVSSGYNVRYHSKLVMDDLLVKIQTYLHENSKRVDKPFVNINHNDLDHTNMTDAIRRQSFLAMFGIKYRYRNDEAIIAGTVDEPVRLKKQDQWVNTTDVKAINAFPDQTVKLDMAPPFGFRWTADSVKVFVREGIPYVNGEPIDLFDGSVMLEASIPYVSKIVDDDLFAKVAAILNGDPISFDDLIWLRTNSIKSYVHWLPDIVDYSLVKILYTKVLNAINSIVSVGPVMRSGAKMQNAIDYVYEGKAWAAFNLFCYLYPDAVKPHGATNFQIKTNSFGYSHLMQSLRELLFSPHSIKYGTMPRIKTKLWDHQRDSETRILKNYSDGKHGAGDASKVGAGKTLVALSVAAELVKQKDQTYYGVLVLLPGDQLMNTWQEEIEKHTEGFDVIYHKKGVVINEIKPNTLVVSTMARQRDHPTDHSWLLLIIDECLTVQNKNALWTESAWKQSAMSKHLLMMSATFFKARYDKLYYMLKMLKTGLPETKQYLGTILSESIVAKMSNIQAAWSSTFHYLTLDKATRSKYDAIANESYSNETMYAKLTSVLVREYKTNANLIKQIADIIANVEKRNGKCLIYARSDEEAEVWSEAFDIPIYPKKGKHCIVTLTKGTYGLNDLVIYDTIVMQPPSPDKLPQIKGRLDRPGQQSNNLFIEYFVVEDTVEMGLILRLEIAAQFVERHIMPLAQFYDISVNYKKFK